MPYTPTPASLDAEPPLWVRYTVPVGVVTLVALGFFVHYLFVL